MTGDIIKKVLELFPADDCVNAIILLEEFKDKHKLSDRVTRCIVVLSNGNIEDLKKNIATAAYDWRDVIYWAEKTDYEYNKPFY